MTCIINSTLSHPFDKIDVPVSQTSILKPCSSISSATEAKEVLLQTFERGRGLGACVAFSSFGYDYLSVMTSDHHVECFDLSEESWKALTSQLTLIPLLTDKQLAECTKFIQSQGTGACFLYTTAKNDPDQQHVHGPNVICYIDAQGHIQKNHFGCIEQAGQPRWKNGGYTPFRPTEIKELIVEMTNIPDYRLFSL